MKNKRVMFYMGLSFTFLVKEFVVVFSDLLSHIQTYYHFSNLLSHFKLTVKFFLFAGFVCVYERIFLILNFLILIMDSVRILVLFS